MASHRNGNVWSVCARRHVARLAVETAKVSVAHIMASCWRAGVASMMYVSSCCALSLRSRMLIPTVVIAIAVIVKCVHR